MDKVTVSKSEFAEIKNKYIFYDVKSLTNHLIINLQIYFAYPQF
jgi:hypothetical protein